MLNDRYALRRRIGAGGMSEVWLGTDLVLGRDVAVKMLNPALAADELFVQRFKQEARAAARLNHPNIVAVYDWGAHAGTYFIAMEYVPGGSLKEAVARRGPLPEGEALAIAAQIAAALEAAHAQGVIHRDVKPQNVLLGANGLVKVADFGIARATGSGQLTDAATVFGSAPYVAPEQAQRGHVDARSDLYSLGVVLYELVTGTVPFTADSAIAIAWQHVHHPPPAPRTLRPDLSPAAEAVVLRALAKPPDARFATAGEMREALELARAALAPAAGRREWRPTTPPLVTRAARPPRPARRVPPRRAAATAATRPLPATPARRATRATPGIGDRVSGSTGAAGASDSKPDSGNRERKRTPADAQGAAPVPGAAPGPGRPAAPTPAARGHHHGRPAARLGALIALALLPLLVGGVALGRSAGLLALPSGEPAGAEVTGGQDLLRLRATAHPAPGTPPPSGEIAPAVAAAPTATPLPSPTAAPTTAPAAPTLAPVAEPPAVPATAPTVPAEATAPTVPAALPPTSVPRAVSTPAPASAPPVQPTAAPAAPASPTRPPPAEGAAPAQAVAAFYQSLVQRRFDQAVALWTPRMQANFPPAENIYSRFAPTQQLTLRRAEVVALDEAAGRATVAIDLIEVYGSPPATRRYVGTWQVVRGPTGWLLDQPSLARG